MSSLQNKIHARRKKLGLTLAQVGDKLGVTRATVLRWENGQIKHIKQDKLQLLAEILQVSCAYLLGFDDEPELPYNILPAETQKLPFMEFIVNGEPVYANEPMPYFTEPDSPVQADFCLRAQGDAMSGARIRDGDLVFVRRQATVNDGDLAVVLLDEEAVLKRVYRLNGGQLLLQVENPACKPIILSGIELDHVRILGKVVAFQSLTK